MAPMRLNLLINLSIIASVKLRNLIYSYELSQLESIREKHCLYSFDTNSRYMCSSFMWYEIQVTERIYAGYRHLVVSAAFLIISALCVSHIFKDSSQAQQARLFAQGKEKKKLEKELYKNEKAKHEENDGFYNATDDQDLICSISLEQMRSPTSLKADGTWFTYDEKFILAWLQRQDRLGVAYTNPLTNKRLESNSGFLVCNKSRKDIIDKRQTIVRAIENYIKIKKESQMTPEKLIKIIYSTNVLIDNHHLRIINLINGAGFIKISSINYMI